MCGLLMKFDTSIPHYLALKTQIIFSCSVIAKFFPSVANLFVELFKECYCMYFQKLISLLATFTGMAASSMMPYLFGHRMWQILVYINYVNYNLLG